MKHNKKWLEVLEKIMMYAMDMIIEFDSAYIRSSKFFFFEH